MIDRKGILSFLGITFLITYAVEGALILSGFRFERIPAMYGQLVVLVAMWVPTVATLLTCRFVTREGLRGLNFHVGSWKPYLVTALIIPLCYALIYGVTWLLGLAQPDWELTQFLGMFKAAGAKLTSMPPVPIVLLALFVSSLVIGPFLNSLAALGEEIGWRGYLLPKLLPLGKPVAYTLMGIIWALWHLPLLLIGFVYPGQPFLGTLAFIGVTTGLGIYINELTLRHRSTILAAWIHGVWNSQKFSIWPLLFPTLNPLIGGYAGLIGIVVWLGLGLYESHRSKASVENTAPVLWRTRIERANENG